MAKRAPNLSTGDHLVDVKCPECGETETISVSLLAEYKRRPEFGSLRVVLSQEKADHRCDEPHLPTPDADPDADNTVVPMWSEGE